MLLVCVRIGTPNQIDFMGRGWEFQIPCFWKCHGIEVDGTLGCVLLLFLARCEAVLGGYSVQTLGMWDVEERLD